MSHFTELHADLQTALGTLVPAVSSVKVELNTGQETWDISEYLNADGSLRIKKSKSIFPYSKMGRLTVATVNLDMINKDNIFNSEYRQPGLPVRGNPQFFYFASTLYSAKAAVDALVYITKGDGAIFKVNDYITIDDGYQTHTTYITSIDTSTYSNFDILYLNASGSKAFEAGAIVEILYLPGKEVTLTSTISGETETVEQFTGYLNEYPRLEQSTARLTLSDRLKRLLEVNLTANDYRVPTGIAAHQVSSTVTYSLDSSSDGELSGCVPRAGHCPIGQWEVEFLDADSFVVTDPTGKKTEGNTGSLFSAYNQFDVLILQIYTSHWSGTFTQGDRVYFKTVHIQGKASLVDNVPEIIYTILTAAGLGADDIDLTAFTDLNSEYDEMIGAIAFTRNTTILNAIEILQQHINACVYTRNDGKISIHAYRPIYQSGGYNTCSQDTDIISVNQEDPGRVDRVAVRFAYNYSTNQFDKELRIPKVTGSDRPEVVVELPAYYEEPQAKAVAERIWAMWRKGMRLYEIEQKWNYGIGVDIGDIIQFSSDNPLLSNKIAEIYEVEKDLINFKVKFRGYDIEELFDDYLFLDVGQKLDFGLKCW